MYAFVFSFSVMMRDVEAPPSSSLKTENFLLWKCAFPNSSHGNQKSETWLFKKNNNGLIWRESRSFSSLGFEQLWAS